jgi:hypothetical protein
MKYLDMLLRQTDIETRAPRGANASLTKLTEAPVKSRTDSLAVPTKLTIPPETPLLSVMSGGSLPISTETGAPVSETAPSVIEMIFRSCKSGRGLMLLEPGPEFPPCPECGATRYWLSRGYLRCGSRACNSAARFALVKMSIDRLN